jgi:hypothetical protein
LIWTAMKRAPATAAEMPAAWVRPFVVTVMVGSLVLVREPGGMSGHVTDARNRCGDPASPCDVTRLVIRPPRGPAGAGGAAAASDGGTVAVARPW